MEAIGTRPSSPTIGDAVAARARDVAIAVVAATVAGLLVGGVGSRLAMRLAAIAAPERRGMVTEAGNVVGDITLAGTIELLLFAGVGSAVIGSGAYVVLRPWLPRGTVRRGLVFGSLLLALMGTTVIDPANSDFVLLGDRALNVVVFSALFPAFGLITSTAIRILDERAPATPTSPRAWALTLLVALPVIPGIAGVGIGSSPTLGIALVTASLAMAAAGRLAPRGDGLAATWLRIAATATMVGVVLVAGSDYVRAVATIL